MAWKAQEATGLSPGTGPTHTRVHVIVAEWMDRQVTDGQKDYVISTYAPFGLRKVLAELTCISNYNVMQVHGLTGWMPLSKRLLGRCPPTPTFANKIDFIGAQPRSVCTGNQGQI